MSNGFDMNFFEIGNPMYLGIAEELVEAQVNDAIDYIRSNYGDHPTSANISFVIEEFDIDYPLLPQWLKDKFDEFDIC